MLQGMIQGRRFLVVGGRSRIGSALADRLTADGAIVQRTSHRPADTAEGYMALDLDGALNGWVPPRGLTAAFLCAGITSLDACRRQPEATRRVNVEAVLHLASRLAEAGVFTVFLSSNWVFDGCRPRVAADAPLAPRIAYGRQKWDAENGLARFFDRVAVVRLTKIVGPDMPLFRMWRDDLTAGRVIRPFTDFPAAPVSMPRVLNALTAVAMAGRGGIWQVSARDDRTYADLARCLTAALGCPAELIAPRCVAESDVFFEDVPRYTTLDTSRLEQAFGWQAPEPEEAVRFFLNGGES